MTRDILTKCIDKYQAKIEDDVRDYIGASSIGSDCLRQIWYAYKGFKGSDVLTKTRRTWAIGKTLEGLIIEWLSLAGFKIEGSQLTFESKNVPELKGHFDGVISGGFLGDSQAILEIKTAKDSLFNEFVKKGVKLWSPQYYAQVQAYMGMSELNSTFIIVLNKDNSSISDEMVVFDEDYYKYLEEKAGVILRSASEPPRVSNSPLWFQCKMCRFAKECHK